jgi:hypothetical protein
MAAQLGQRVVPERPLHRRLHPGGRADADGVGDADVVHADAVHQGHDPFDLVQADLALVRTAKSARDGAPHLQAGFVRCGDDGAEAFHRLGDRAVDVALAEGLAGGAEDDDLVGPRGRVGERRHQALEVGRQHRMANARRSRDAGHHDRVVGHLRHPLRADVAGDLDLAAAGGLQAGDQFDLVSGAHRLRFVLQPVARAHFDQGHVARKHGVVSTLERTAL